MAMFAVRATSTSSSMQSWKDEMRNLVGTLPYLVTAPRDKPQSVESDREQAVRKFLELNHGMAGAEDSQKSRETPETQ